MPYDLTRLRRWCVALNWVFVAASLYLGTLTGWELWIGDPFTLPDQDTLSLMTWPILIRVVDLVAAVAVLMAYLLNCIWIYRASANARALDPWKGRIKPGWAIGWNFVPIANLWMPYRAIREIWTSSMAPGCQSTGPRPVFFVFCWAAWIIASLLASVSFRVSMEGDPGSYAASLSLDAIATPFDVVAAILFIRIISEVTDAQAMQQAAPAVFD